MIICPQCANEAYYGTLFCGECGTILVQLTAAGNREYAAPKPDGYAEDSENDPGFDGLAKGASHGLRLLTTGEVIPLAGREQFTLGRAMKDQAVIPDIDLDPFGAASQGVSRLHAEIRIGKDDSHVTDLDSSNGTRLNGAQLKPYVATPITQGDLLAIGGLQFQLVASAPQ